MAREILTSVPNIVGVSADYPNGRIRNSSTGISGTGVVEELYGDIIQFFEKLVIDAGISKNNMPDNVTNGYQLIAALDARIVTGSNTISVSSGSTFLGSGANPNFTLNNDDGTTGNHRSILFRGKGTNDLMSAISSVAIASSEAGSVGDLVFYSTKSGSGIVTPVENLRLPSSGGISVTGFGRFSNSIIINRSSDQIQLQAYTSTTRQWRMGTSIGNSGLNGNFTIWETVLGNALYINQSSGLVTLLNSLLVNGQVDATKGIFASSFSAPSSGGISSDTRIIASNNNNANGNVNISILSRSSGTSRLNFGTHISETTASIFRGPGTTNLSFTGGHFNFDGGLSLAGGINLNGTIFSNSNVDVRIDGDNNGTAEFRVIGTNGTVFRAIEDTGVAVLGSCIATREVGAWQLSLGDQGDAINTTSNNVIINQRNGGGGVVNFKDFIVRDGKASNIMVLTGSTKSAVFLGRLEGRIIKSNATSDQIQLQAYTSVTRTWRMGTNIGSSGANGNLTIWESVLGNALYINQSSGLVTLLNSLAVSGRTTTETLRVTNGAGAGRVLMSDADGDIVPNSNFSKSEQGFVELGGGILLQWGTVITNTGSTIVTLPRALSSAAYSVVVTEFTPSNRNPSTVGYRINNITATQFEIAVNSIGSRFHYQVIGAV